MLGTNPSSVPLSKLTFPLTTTLCNLATQAMPSPVILARVPVPLPCRALKATTDTDKFEKQTRDDESTVSASLTGLHVAKSRVLISHHVYKNAF